MDRSRFDGWCWNSSRASFVLSMIVMEVRKRVHSMRMLVKLVIGMAWVPRPYQFVVMGHSICVPPVR